MSPLYKRMTEGLQKTLQGRRKQLSALAKPLTNLMMQRLSDETSISYTLFAHFQIKG
jgi:hypothetical protein